MLVDLIEAHKTFITINCNGVESMELEALEAVSCLISL